MSKAMSTLIYGTATPPRWSWPRPVRGGKRCGEETQKPWPFVKELRRSVKMAPLWSIFDSFDYAEVCVKKAEKRVDEVFL